MFFCNLNCLKIEKVIYNYERYSSILIDHPVIPALKYRNGHNLAHKNQTPLV